MVNYTNGLTLPRKSNMIADRDAVLSRSQIDLYKQDSCHMVHQPFPMQQQATQLSELPGMQSDTFVTQPKPSPSYMDSDAHFNFPNYLNKSSSHVMTEQCEQLAMMPPVCAVQVPALERQYSINTIMEVIETHDINDMSSSNFTGGQMQTCSTLQTQPMDIQRPTAPPTSYDHSFTDQFLASSNENQQVTILAPPASDIREYKHDSVAYGSSVSSSPGGIRAPSTQYQKDFINHTSPNQFPTINDRQQYSTYQNEYTNKGCSTTSYQPTEDQMSPFHSALSPYQYDMMQSPALTTGDNVGSENNEVFTFDNYSGQFKPSQSCPNFNAFPQQQYPSQSTSSETLYPVFEPSTACPPPPYSASVASDSTAQNGFGGTETTQFQLEEVDNSILNDDMTLMSEQERLDQKRIRNNMACRASRERRKKRKVETENHVQLLENRNRLLKDQIRKLEEDVRSAHENVRKIMNQS